MYYLAKIAQAAGLTIILFGFIIRFPELISYQTLLTGMGTFVFGLVIQKFLLQK